MLPSLAHHLFRRIADNRNPDSWSARLRDRRMDVVRRLLLEIPHRKRILDVGGAPSFWRALKNDAADDVEVTLLNLVPFEGEIPPGFRTVVGDARDLSKFRDGQFDLVFSNSVIEHVGGHPDQKRMADEVRRVGKRYVVQTPNKNFPVEPHFLLPAFQFYPRALQVALVQRFGLGWYERQPDRSRAESLVDSHHLLNARQLRRLFPDAVILEEKVLGLTKSLTALGPKATLRG